MQFMLDILIRLCYHKCIRESEDNAVTIHEFIEKHNVRFTSICPADSNPNNETPIKGQHHWHLTISVGNRPNDIELFFSNSVANGTAAPAIEEVLDGLVIDAGAGDLTFEEFCSELGYDTDSRRAEKTWRACRKVGRQTYKAFGSELFRVIQAEVERL